MTHQWHTEQVSIDENVDSIETCYKNGWADGLPVVPPTPKRVEKMLSGIDRSPDELIASLLPKWGRVTIGKIAINAVMAVDANRIIYTPFSTRQNPVLTDKQQLIYKIHSNDV